VSLDSVTQLRLRHRSAIDWRARHGGENEIVTVSAALALRCLLTLADLADLDRPTVGISRPFASASFDVQMVSSLNDIGSKSGPRILV
jgi:hypothetical protein